MNLRFDPGGQPTQNLNLLNRVCLIASVLDGTPPRAVILREEDLAVPPRQIQFGCVVPVLHAAKTVNEQQRFSSAHPEDECVWVLIFGVVGHPATLSRNSRAVNL
jgi:hypothetical protein